MPKHRCNSIRGAMVRAIENGEKRFTLPSEWAKQCFYKLTDERGLERMVRRSHEFSGWVGYIGQSTARPKPKVSYEAVPPLWSDEVLFDDHGKPLLKFLHAPFKKKNDLYPEHWYFLDKKYFIRVQPRYSESPVACLANLAMPVGTMTQENTMIACADTGRFLGWPITLARSLRSIPTGTEEILGEIIDIAFEHLRVFHHDFNKDDFWRLCKDENLRFEKPVPEQTEEEFHAQLAMEAKNKE